MSENENGFGQLIERERAKQEISLSKITERIGKDEDGKDKIGPSYIHRLEKGDKKNPSFIYVCLLAEALSLDMREVFKVFGYEHLLNSDTAGSTNTIEETIRLNDISVLTSLSKENEANKKEYLSPKEKEQLIEIITSIFDFSSSDSDKSLEDIPTMIEKILRFRAIYQGGIPKKS